MELGDTVTVRATGRRARLIEALDRDRYVVEFLPDPRMDPIDRDTVQSEDEGVSTAPMSWSQSSHNVGNSVHGCLIRDAN
jgi:hypothetical protein